jgi:hypothetical protein
VTQRFKQCKACYKNKELDKDYKCQKSQNPDSLVTHCDIYNSLDKYCMRCDKGYMLIINGYRNLCVERNLGNFHCMKQEGQYCHQCDLTAYMDPRFQCHSREKKNYTITIVISLIILLTVCIIYGCYFYKCRRKRKERNRRRKEFQRVEALL